jgi:hypothetical protein
MKTFVSVLVVASLVATPAAASVRDAAFASSADRGRAETSMFVGVSYRVTSNHRTSAPQGRASFKMSGMAHTPGTSDFKFGHGLEISSGETGKPALFVAGHDVGQLDRKAHLSGGNTALIVVGVLVVAAAVAAVVVVNELDECGGNECE